MGMTLWLQTRTAGHIDGESADHSRLHQLADELDRLCSQLGQPALTGFFDYSDALEDLEDELDDFEDAELQGLPTGEHPGRWFAASTALPMLQALQQSVANGWNPRLSSSTRQQLLAELQDCLQCLQPLAGHEGEFRLLAVP